MEIRRRMVNAAAIEARERATRIRADARRGKSAAQIAAALELPLKMVEQIVAPVADARLTPPVQLLAKRAPAPGLPPADVQAYWIGFLTAAGRICGQGSSFVLILTLGDRSEDFMKTFMADLATPQARHEFCRSSLLGWQLYVREQTLCKSLLPWGIPSDLHGDDPTILEDLPKDLMAPFMHGYLDGNWAPPGSPARPSGLVLWGTEPVLAAISKMVARGWSVKGGVVTPKPPRAALRFGREQEHTIQSRVQAYTARARFARRRQPA